MKLSGFTIIRNAIIYDYPIVECINSIIDIVDEFIVVAGDSCDATDELLKNIKSPKLKIIHSNWDLEKFCKDGVIYAHQTDLALRECSGDWCFYIQSDEVLHESALPVIKQACEQYVDDPQIEGFVLKYVHLYADYKHYIDNLHFAYPREIRIIRNNPDIHSWRDAQSFRVYNDFSDMDYLRKKGTRKLNCILLNAVMFHYGWSRDPRCLVGKVAAQKHIYNPDSHYIPDKDYYDYGNLSMLPQFTGAHPKVMVERVENCDWDHLVRFSGKRPNILKRYGMKYRILTFLENKLLKGKRIGGFKNYELK